MIGETPDGATVRAVGSVVVEIRAELLRAMALHAPMNSPHEAYAVILEELDEFWLEVKKKKQDPVVLYEELIHIAAMAARAAIDGKLVPQ